MTTEITFNRSINANQLQKENNISNKDKTTQENNLEEKNINITSKNQANTSVLKVNDAEVNLVSFESPLRKAHITKNDDGTTIKKTREENVNLTSVMFREPEERLTLTKENLINIVKELKESNKEGNIRLAKVIEENLSNFSEESDSSKVLLSSTIVNIIREISNPKITAEAKEKIVLEKFEKLKEVNEFISNNSFSKDELKVTLNNLGGVYDKTHFNELIERDIRLVTLDTQVNKSLKVFNESDNNLDKKAGELIQIIKDQSKLLPQSERISILRDVVDAISNNNNQRERVELLRQRIEESNVNKEISSKNELNADVIEKFSQRSPMISKQVIERVRNGNLSPTDISKLIGNIKRQLNSDRLDENLRSDLAIELTKLEALNTQLKTAETELSESRVGLITKSNEIRAEIENLRSKSPELATMLEKSLDMVENSKTEASMRLRFMFLCEVQKIITSDDSVKSKLSKLSKIEEEYTNMVSKIQKVSSDEQISDKDATRQIKGLLLKFGKDGGILGGLFGKKPTEQETEVADSTATVLVSSVRNGAIGVAAVGIISNDATNEEVIVEENSNSATFSSGTNQVVARASFSNGENLTETSTITHEVSESISNVIETGKREPQKIEEAFNYWKENNSFDEYVVASENVFRAEDKVNEIRNEFAQALEITSNKLDVIYNTSIENDKQSQYIAEEVNNLIEQANILEMNIIDDFTQDPESEISELLKKFREIISDLDIQTRDSIAKKELKVKIDRDFLRRIKENKDHQEKLDMQREELKKEFDVIKMKAMQGLS